jgi:hypothetical protein
MRHVIRTDTSTAWFVFAITPNDSVDLAAFIRGIYVGGTGDVALICEDNTAAVTFVGVPTGTILPVRAKRVLSTGTTATNLVGLV